MPPEDWYAYVQQAAGPDGRLPLSRMTRWDIFPFEQAGLQVVPLAPPQLPEPPRGGEGDRPCLACAQERDNVWTDAHWRLYVFGPGTGVPLVLVLEPLAHHDLADLPEERAGELGRLMVHVARAVEALPHVARAHVSRWGDGGAHLHVLFFARPAGFTQLRGTCLAVWDDLLPPAPADQQAADAAAVARALAASYGGTAA